MFLSMMAGVVGAPPAAPAFSITPLGVSGTMHGSGFANPGIPGAYAGPVGAQRDLATACLLSVNTTIPTMPPDLGWISLHTAVSANRSLRWMHRWLASDDEAFGTPADAIRALCWTHRFVSAPDFPFAYVGSPGTGNPTSLARTSTQSSTNGNTVRHTAHTLIQEEAHLLSAMIVAANVTADPNAAALNRTGLIVNSEDGGVIGTGSSKVVYGRSDGAVASWAQQDRPASGSSESLSSVVELISA